MPDTAQKETAARAERDIPHAHTLKNVRDGSGGAGIFVNANGGRTLPDPDVLRLTPADLPGENRLVERLLPTSWLQRLAPSEIFFQGITWRPGQGHPPPPLDEALDARTRKKPPVLLLDEAHTLAERVGCTLLSASQQVGRELPFLLVLAGTPNLRSHLNTMNASFWSRADRRPVGRLDSEATAAAIREPLQSEDIAIDEDALAHVVRENHGYPHFVQRCGGRRWSRAPAG